MANIGFKKFVRFLAIPALILIFLLPIFTPFAESFNFPNRYDLVAILVEQGLYRDESDYNGLVGIAAGPIIKTTNKARVDRYAIDLQNALPGTRALIIQVDRFEDPANIAKVLERFYFEGDPKEPTRIAYLKGIVVIGEVPLPVVNKKGSRFISLFPYTDFEQKAYVWNPTTHDFEIRDENPNPQPEVWHGVIRPPISTQTQDGKNMVAAYFDKNHLYHLGDAAYSDFGKRVFFQDFVEENKNLNETAYKSYLQYLKHQGDIAYLRYTKQLFKDLSGPMEAEMDADSASADEAMAQLRQMGIPVDTNVPRPDLGGGDPPAGATVNKDDISDIMTKLGPEEQSMSDSLMVRFYKLFSKYPGLVNDFIGYTGRYADVDSAVNLITTKDKSTLYYLKGVNTMVEKKIDDFVNQLQKNIILADVQISAQLVDRKMPLNAPPIPIVNGLKQNADFVNFSLQFQNASGTDFQNRLNGYLLSDVNSASQCTPYRGSKGNAPYSKLVETNRALDLKSASEYDSGADATTGRTSEEKDAGFQCHSDNGKCEGYESFAGCFYDNNGHLYDNPEAGVQACFPEHATDPVFTITGTREVAGAAPPNFDNFKSCLNFYEKNQYINYLKSVDDRLENVDDNYQWSRATKIDKLRAKALASKETHPNAIKLFTSIDPLDPFEVTLGDVLRGLGWNPAANPDAWRQTLVAFLISTIPPNDRTVQIDHPKIADIHLVLTHPVERQISSVIYHKEPTNETISAQSLNMISKDLPVDNPRYVTFQNKVGGVARIDYPDLFKEESFDAFLGKLREAENQINALPRDPDTPAPCQNCLTGLVSNLPELNSFPPKTEIVVERANLLKVQDALSWKNMDIDSKHKYLIENYLDSRPARDTYVGKSPNGYELTYLNGEGFTDKYLFFLSKDVSLEEGTGAGAGAGLGAEKPAEYKDDPTNPFDDNPPADTSNQGGYDLFSWSPPPISPWWERMKEWYGGLKQTTFEVSFGEPQDQFYNKLDNEAKKAEEDVKKQSSEIESSIATGGEVNFSKIASILLEADSSMVVTGKKTELNLKLKDKDGNLVNDEFSKITLVLEGDGRFSDDVEDDSPADPGIQITMMSGSRNIGVVAPEKPAELKLTAQLDGTDKKVQVNVSAVANAKLSVETATLGLTANGANQITLDVRAVGENNQTLSNFNGIVQVGVSDPLMGQIVESEVLMRGGRGVCHFKAGKKAGKVVINAVSAALDSGQIDLSLLPGPSVAVGLTSDSDVLEAEPGAQVQIEARIFDANGNMVDTNSNVQINFDISERTSRFGALSSMSEIVRNGVARVRLLPRDQTGTVEINAQARGLSPATLTIKSAKVFGQSDLSQMQPQSLAVSLLGIPGGNVEQNGYLGGLFVMNGKTEVANSLTAQPKQYKKLFEVNDNGGIFIPDPAKISAQALPANNFTMVLRDNETQLDLAHITVFTLKDGQFDVTGEAEPDNLGDGIYMRKIAAEDSYKVDKLKGALRVVKGDNERLEIQTNGFLRVFDNDFSVRPRNGKFLILQVFDKDAPVAEIYFVERFSQDVKIQNEISDAPGVYVSPFKLPPQYFYENALSGNSSANPKGFAFYDKSEEIKGASAPGFSFQSLEDSLDRFGVGFTEDNKFALLFSAGETFGEANRLYASDIGIVLGDPTVRVDNKTPGDFSTDTGKMFYSGAADVRAVTALDYNNDGFDDILILEGEGRLRLMQNNGGYDQMKDQGYILDIKNGIQDLTKIDYNNDGQMDLAVAGKVSCRQGDTCVDVYENQNGAFIRHNLHYDGQQMIVTLRAQDLNLDGFPDLVFADAAGDIRVLYNRRGQFDQTSQLIGNVGLQVDPTKNLVSNVLLHYPGMTSKNPNDPVSMQKYQTFATGEDFIYADLDAGTFAASTKLAQDLNGGIVEKGDVIRYTLTLKNDSPSAKQGLSVSDVISEQLELNKDSIRCTDCAANEMQIEELNGEQTRPYLFKNINVPAHESRHIVYDTTFKGDTGSADKISMTFSNSFTDTNPALAAVLKQDAYPDISVTKAGNQTGRVRFYYTTGIDRNGNLQWGSELSSPPAPMTAAEMRTKTGLDIPNPNDIDGSTIVKCQLRRPDRVENLSKKDCEARGGVAGDPIGPPPAATDQLKKIQGDSDGDGLPDLVDDVNGTLDGLTETTKAVVSKLTCDAGCLALPLNVAFLAPGPWSILGTPFGFDGGFPVFAWGVPSPWPVWPWSNPFVPTPVGQAPALAAGGRFYVSPTLTGGVGFSLCLGPYGTPKNCWSFGLNPLDLIPQTKSLCSKLNGAVGGALSAANSAVGKVNEGLTVSLGGSGQGTTGGGGRDSSGSGLGNYSLGSYDSPVAKSKNIRIPGFPSVATDWLARQWEEITDKAFAIPDLYVIYPAFDSMGRSVLPSQDFKRTGDLLTNVLSWVNSIPLIDIETEEVLIKVPLPTRNEIEKFKADARQWIEDERVELDRWANLMGCFGITQGAQRLITGTSTLPVSNILNSELCRFVDVEMNKMIATVGQNMRALDDWILFPKKILQLRAIESYYLGQIVDYLDTVMEFTGGWVKRNTARITQWRRAIREIKQNIQSWKAIFQLMVDYNESCDKCKTERYSLKDLLLKLFIGIPSPPVIPIPKLPDIVVDVSKIQAGLKIKWPDIKFKPEPLTIPRLPRISLGVGLTIPQFKLMAPAIPIIPSPPDVVPRLPALPKLNLPKLPDLPPPPKMPGLPPQLQALISVFKKIVKILCIIKSGFVPTDELLLKTKIEEITARGLNPILPIDTLFTVQTPTIKVTYIDQLVITAFTNLGFDTSYILKRAQDIAKGANTFSTNLTKGINNFTDNLSKQLEKVTSPTIDMSGPAGGAQINYLEEKNLSALLSQALGTDASELVHYGMQLRSIVSSLEETRKDDQKTIAELPTSIKLEVSSEKFVPGKKVSLEDGDLILPFQQRLKTYRDHLAAYVDDSEKLSKQSELGFEFDDLNKFIASQASPFVASDLKKYLAASDFEALFSQKASGPTKLGQLDLEKTEWLPQDDTKNLLAFNIPMPPEIPLSADAANAPGNGGPGGAGDIRNIGLFYVAPNGESKRLVDYTLEANKPSQLADIDVDRDGDTDKIYSYGPNVFIKKSEARNGGEARPTFRPVDLEYWTVFELLPKGGSPNYPKSLTESVTEASFSFEKPDMNNVAGFEVIAKNSPAFFETPGSDATIKAHLLQDPQAMVQEPVQQVSIENPEGQIFVNDAAVSFKSNTPETPKEFFMNVGDKIGTGEKSSVVLSAADGTRISVAENTQFTLTQSGPFEVLKGNVEINQSRPGSILFPSGRTVRAIDGSIRLRFFDGSDLLIQTGQEFELPDMRAISATLKSAGGSATFTGSKRQYIQSRDGKVHLGPGDILHPLQIVHIKWNVSESSTRDMTLSSGVLVTVPGSFSNGMDVEVKDGMLEVIKTEKAAQPVAAGMALLFGDQIKVNNGSIEIHYANGGDTGVRGNETYLLNKLEDFNNPTVSLHLPPAFYFAKIYAFDSQGNRSNGSEKILLAPQICGDKTPPLANFGKAEFEIALGKTLKLDASRSFDAMSKVISYTLDINTSVDSSGDGIANNDRDLWTDADPNVDSDSDSVAGNDGDSPVFSVGPYEEVGQKNMRLTVRDEALNGGYQDIVVKIVAPQIVLDAPPLHSGTISGFVEPVEENVPITIARFRSGTSSLGWEMIKTPSADANGQYYTNTNGRFTIKDADMRDRLVLRNSEGKIIAEINVKTGAITILDDRYEVRVIPASPPNFGVRTGVFLKADQTTDNPLTFAYFVPDVNTDTSIDNVDTKYDEQAAQEMSGVHLKPLGKASELGFTFKVLPGDDPHIPGATVVERLGERAAAIDVNGDIVLIDKDLSLRVKTPTVPASESNAPVTFEMLYKGDVIAEIFIAAHLGRTDRVQIVDAPAVPLRPKTKSKPAVESAGNNKEFTDVKKDDPLAGILEKLATRGIVAGYPSNVKGELLFKPENPINRAEFTQITMKMLCIVPRPEAKILPTPFYDVLDPKLWFYPILKEGNIRGFIKGYLGEKKIGEDGITRTPFKPANHITRAEAATVVLAALWEEDIIDLSKVDFTLKQGGNWYDPYIEIAQNLKPYLKSGKEEGRAFLITPEEAKKTGIEITRREFATMADRVLLIYDCFNPDADHDGLPDVWERQYVKNIEDLKPTEDLDGDQCTNAKEYELGTSPVKADTDEGGVPDCEESARGTDPLNPFDDKAQELPKVTTNEEGIFVLRPACGNVCPCRATLGEGADLTLDDIIFAAITGKGGLPIYAKSNEEKY